MAGTPGIFSVLVVCTGNICRSALAERLLGARLGDRVQPAAELVAVASAGTAGLEGRPMDPTAAERLRALGGDDDGFVARRLTAEHIRAADLVLTATRAHRASAVRLAPEASSRTFTLREFASLARAVDPAALPADGAAVDRLRAAVAEAAALRGHAVAPASGAEDIPDPYGAAPELHAEVAALVAEALDPIVELLAAACHSPTPGTVAGPNGNGVGRAAPGATPGDAAGTARRPVPPARRLGLAAVGMLALALVTAGWLGWRVWQAHSELAAAQAAADRVAAGLLSGDTAAARRELATLRQHTGAGRRAVSDPLWGAATALPGVGDDLEAVRRVAVAVDDVATGVLPTLTRAGAALRPETLRIAGDRFDLGPLERAAPDLEAAAARSARIGEALAAMDTAGLLGPVRDGVRDAQAVTARLADSTSAASAAARLIPPMLGGDGARRYFLAFQNNAEARGTGGLLGAYGVLEADHGRVRVLRLGPNTDLRSLRRMPLDLGPDFDALYGEDPALWVNANMSPHFPYAARLWLEMWRRQFGQRLDGVIATDPVAMSYVLRATGPALLPSGERITPDNAVTMTLRDVYARFPDDNDRRDAFLQQIARVMFAKLLGGAGEPQALAGALGRATGEKRLLVYSTRAAEQQRLAATEVGGTLPETAGPFAAVVVNNAAGSKLDYYLHRTLSYTTRGCLYGMPRTRIEVTLTNTAPGGGLPPYVTMRLDPAGGTRGAREPSGTNVSLVSVYAARGAGLLGATRDGKRLLVHAGLERGHPVFTTRVTLPPGGTSRFSFDLVEPASSASPQGWAQPLVLPQETPAFATRIGCATAS